jgi:hypothetical protein
MALASRRTCVFEDEDIRQILVEDEYTKIPRNEARVGDFVVYTFDTNEVTHVAVITRQPLEDPDNMSVMSAWGQDGEYYHQVTDVPPLLGTPTEYWTDRRLIHGI